VYYVGILESRSLPEVDFSPGSLSIPNLALNVASDALPVGGPDLPGGRAYHPKVSHDGER
jgi:hypothetical protein